MLGIDKLIETAAEQALSEVFGTGVYSFSEWASLRRAIPKALTNAHEQFVLRYKVHDPELVAHLEAKDPVTTSPRLKSALATILRRPFDDPDTTTSLLNQAFQAALPPTYAPARVAAAVRAYWALLEREVMYISQLQQLYTLGYQRSAADQARQLAQSAAQMVEGITALRDEVRSQGLLAGSSTPQLPAPTAERRRPWHKLPNRPYTQFVGRQAELAQLRRLLLPHPRSRIYLTTINGIGGVGKSALALELAHAYVDYYDALPPEERFEVIVWVSAKETILTPDGIHNRRSTFGDLDDLFREIAGVMQQPGLVQGDPDERRSQIEQALSAERTLLIVDNLETVDDEELLSFLRELPDPTKAVVTTRHRIDVAKDVRLLGMPRADAELLITNEIGESPIALSPEQRDELYRRTGGVPLAIVYSIGQLRRGLSAEAMLRRLGSGQNDIARFCFTESARLIAGRHAESLLLALALFDQSVGWQMLGAVAGLADDLYSRDEGLAELLQLSLANQQANRFDLLPLTRSFARDLLQTTPEREDELRQRWIDQLTALARPYNAIHYNQPSADTLLSEGEHILSLIRWAEQQERPDLVMPLAPAAIYFLDTSGDWSALQLLARQCLSYATLLRLEHEKVQPLNAIAWIQSQQGDYEAAKATLAIALEQARRHSSVAWQIEVLTNQIANTRRMGDLAAAETQVEAAEQLLDQLSGSDWASARAEVTYERGKIARDRGDWEQARQHFEEALTVFSVDEAQPRFNPERSWGMLGNLGYVLHRQGQLDEADAIYQRCLNFFRQSGGRGYTATLLMRRAQLLLQRGDVAAAHAHAEESMRLSTRLGMVEEQRQAQTLLAQHAPDTAENQP